MQFPISAKPRTLPWPTSGDTFIFPSASSDDIDAFSATIVCWRVTMKICEDTVPIWVWPEAIPLIAIVAIIH